MTNTDTAKEIAKDLRSNKIYHLNARARNGKVFVTTHQPTWVVTDLLPAGWGASLTSKYDHLVISWVG